MNYPNPNNNDAERISPSSETSRACRILFLTLKTFSATGGIEKFNRCFCKALQENGVEQGWETEVLSAYDGLPDEQYFPGTDFKGFRGSKWRFFVAAIRSMRKADVVVFSHINLAVLMWCCRRFFPGKQTICMAHGREVWEPLSSIQASALKGVQQVWAVSRYTAGILHTEKGVAAGNINIFYNTLDPFFAAGNATESRETLRKRYGILPGEKVELTVARLAGTEQFKGYDAVLKVLPAICKSFPGVKYLLCGKWEEVEKKRITKLINELKLYNVVITTGFIKDSELTAHYGMADLFVLPSRKEGFGIVFLEAAWCGLPVIGGNRDGSTEALLNGELGELVDPENLGEIENAIRRQLAHPLTAGQKQQQRTLVDAHFGFPVFKKRQAEMLKRVRG